MSKRRFLGKSACANRVTTVWLRRDRKNTRVQKKNRVKRTYEARVMAVEIFFFRSHLNSTIQRMSKLRFLENRLAQTTLR